MKAKKVISILLALCLLQILLFAVNVSAAETFTYSVNTSTSAPMIGNTVVLTVSLTNYDTASAGIRGLQIDITNIDASVFEIISHSSSITDPSAASNTTSYSSANKRIRLTYANLSGTLDHSATEVMSITLKVKSDLTSAGSITLPITVKIVATDGESTQTSSTAIDYVMSTSPLIDVAVGWGSMEFEYSDGTWNPQTHTYENGGWSCASDANKISVTSESNVPITVSYAYAKEAEYTIINGSFTDGTNTITSQNLAAGNVIPQSCNAFLVLSGQPPEINNVKIGAITVTINN